MALNNAYILRYIKINKYLVILTSKSHITIILSKYLNIGNTEGITSGTFPKY